MIEAEVEEIRDSSSEKRQKKDEEGGGIPVSQSDCIQRMIHDTKQYLSTLKKVAKFIPSDLSSCCDFSLLSLISHAITLRDGAESEPTKRPCPGISISEFLDFEECPHSPLRRNSKTTESTEIQLPPSPKQQRFREREGGGESQRSVTF